MCDAKPSSSCILTLCISKIGVYTDMTLVQSLGLEGYEKIRKHKLIKGGGVGTIPSMLDFCKVTILSSLCVGSFPRV